MNTKLKFGLTLIFGAALLASHSSHLSSLPPQIKIENDKADITTMSGRGGFRAYDPYFVPINIVPTDIKVVAIANTSSH